MSELNENPVVEVQRRLIESKRDQYRAAGFEAELDVATFKVQRVKTAVEEREKQKQIEDKRLTAENCYASARELDRLLKELPEPKKEDALSE